MKGSFKRRDIPVNKLTRSERQALRVTFFWQAEPWKHIEGECWPWLGTKDQSGYGKIWLRSRHKLLMAHCVSVMIALELKGLPRVPDCVVLHGCDNRLCVNPSHLTVGSHYENAQDALEKGRRRGSPKQLRIFPLTSQR